MYDKTPSPLDNIPDLEPVSEEFMQRMIERHERVILPRVLAQEHERIEAAQRIRKIPLF